MKIKELILEALIPLSGVVFLIGWMMVSINLFDANYSGTGLAAIGALVCLFGFFVFMLASILKHSRLRKNLFETAWHARFFERVVDALPIAIFAKDVNKDFCWTYINPKGTEMTGFLKEDFYGKTDYELFPKDQADFFHSIDLKVISSKETHFVSVESITSKRGTWLGRVKKAPVFDIDGSPIAVIGMVEDITEQQKSEDRLREFGEIIRSMNDGVMISLPEQEGIPGKIIFVNEAFARISGYTIEDALDKSPRILFDGLGEQATIIADRIKSSLRTNQSFLGEIPIRRRDGADSWVSLSAFPVKEPNGKVKHFVFILRDITQNKLREEELRRARLLKERQQELLLQKEKAEAANQAKSEFLANMSHELRTPLNSILGMTRLLTETELKGEQSDIASVVLHSSTHLLEIVNDILDLSKIEAQEVHLEKIGFDPGATLNDVATTLQPLASNKNLLLIRDFAETDFPYIIGDPVRLSRVLTNLIGNAIKYTDEGCVQIQAIVDRIDDQRINLTCKIIDTGIGIPPEKLESVFDKFVQADTSTTRRYGGTGLGLAITKQLVELMEGKIGAISRIGEGSTFWFTIPFEVTNEIDKQLDPNRRRAASGTVPLDQAKVLVAEDHPMNQLLMKKLMSSFGIVNHRIVDNGKKALDAYKAEHWDVILMDVHMPELNGFEATTAIRTLEKISGARTPIVALTANAMAGDREKCLRYDMDDYISKPVNIEDMKEILGQWLKFESSGEDEFPEIKSMPTAPKGAVVISSPVQAKPESIDAPLPDISEKLPLDLDSFLNESPVNLEHLHSFTGGDPSADKELIDVFIEQSDKNVETLKKNVADGENIIWAETAHMLKGGAGAIGANGLASLCAVAQKMFDSTRSDRLKMLEDIEKEYQTVKNHLKKIGLL